MKSIARKFGVLVSAFALGAFVSVSYTNTAEAGLGIKIPNIKIKTNGGQTTNTTSEKPVGNTISGKLSFNESNSCLPGSGFDVYLVDGHFSYSNSCYREDGGVLRILVKGQKLATSDANGNYSAPMPSNVSAYATQGQFPEVRLLFYKPNVGFSTDTRDVKYLGSFRETKNLSIPMRGRNTSSIVFQPK